MSHKTRAADARGAALPAGSCAAVEPWLQWPGLGSPEFFLPRQQRRADSWPIVVVCPGSGSDSRSDLAQHPGDNGWRSSRGAQVGAGGCRCLRMSSMQHRSRLPNVSREIAWSSRSNGRRRCWRSPGLTPSARTPRARRLSDRKRTGKKQRVTRSDDKPRVQAGTVVAWCASWPPVRAHRPQCRTCSLCRSIGTQNRAEHERRAHPRRREAPPQRSAGDGGVPKRWVRGIRDLSAVQRCGGD